MPLFDFQCQDCSSVFEALVDSHDKKTMRCRHCGGPSKRRAVSIFRIGGRKTAVSNTALRATGRDFINNPDSFVAAMDTFGDKIGDRLTGRQMEKAVEQIKAIKR